MKCIICKKKLKEKSAYQVHKDKCSQAFSIVYTSVDDSKYELKNTHDLEVLKLALKCEKRGEQRKGIIQGIERRMRKIQKETKKK